MPVVQAMCGLHENKRSALMDFILHILNTCPYKNVLKNLKEDQQTQKYKIHQISNRIFHAWTRKSSTYIAKVLTALKCNSPKAARSQRWWQSSSRGQEANDIRRHLHRFNQGFFLRNSILSRLIVWKKTPYGKYRNCQKSLKILLYI